MNSMIQGIKKFVREEDGVTAVEYGVLAAVIIVVCIVTLQGLGNALNGMFAGITTAL